VDFDWEKVNSSHGHMREEMKTFIEKAKKLVPMLVAIISPSVASTTSAMPPLTVEDPALSSTIGEEFIMPSSTTEQNAEVA
jgi:hypothetical protein